MKKSELRKIIKEELDELSGLRIRSHTYYNPVFNKDVYVGEDGLLGFRERHIDWSSIEKIFKLGKKDHWI